MNTVPFKRKVVGHGSALYVNLPSVWIAQTSTTKGATLLLDWDPHTATLTIKGGTP